MESRDCTICNQPILSCRCDGNPFSNPKPREQMSFSDEELELIKDALPLKFCFLETGNALVSYDDMVRTDDSSRKRLCLRMPSREQLELAKKYRDLWSRILQR